VRQRRDEPDDDVAVRLALLRRQRRAVAFGKTFARRNPSCTHPFQQRVVREPPGPRWVPVVPEAPIRSAMARSRGTGKTRPADGRARRLVPRRHDAAKSVSPFASSAEAIHASSGTGMSFVTDRHPYIDVIGHGGQHSSTTKSKDSFDSTDQVRVVGEGRYGRTRLFWVGNVSVTCTYQITSGRELLEL